MRVEEFVPIEDDDGQMRWALDGVFLQVSAPMPGNSIWRWCVWADEPMVLGENGSAATEEDASALGRLAAVRLLTDLMGDPQMNRTDGPKDTMADEDDDRLSDPMISPTKREDG